MNQTYSGEADFGQTVDPALITLTKIVYLLQALGYVTGLSYIAAVIINYVKIDEVRGSWLESHFRWQIRTFWFSLLWYFIGALLMVIGIGYVLIVFTTFWVLYRIIKGWLRVIDHKAMYS